MKILIFCVFFIPRVIHTFYACIHMHVLEIIKIMFFSLGYIITNRYVYV